MASTEDWLAIHPDDASSTLFLSSIPPTFKMERLPEIFATITNDQIDYEAHDDEGELEEGELRSAWIFFRSEEAGTFWSSPTARHRVCLHIFASCLL
jgi:hypothetical protein